LGLFFISYLFFGHNRFFTQNNGSLRFKPPALEVEIFT